MNNNLKEIDKLRRTRLMVNQSKITDDEKRQLKLKMQICLNQMRSKTRAF